MAFLGFMLVFVGGCVLSFSGFGLNTWQYWAISLPLIFGSVIVGAAR